MNPARFGLWCVRRSTCRRVPPQLAAEDPWADHADLNRDGIVDEADLVLWEALQRADDGRWPAGWLLGDLDGDGELSDADDDLLLIEIDNNEPDAAADLNGDGVVDERDAALLDGVVFQEAGGADRGGTRTRERGESDHYEIGLINKDGERITILVSGSPRYDKDGAFAGTMGVFSDITKLEAAEREINSLAKFPIPDWM